jgi:hypothetical protein
LAKLIYIGEEEKEIVNFGVYKPGDEVDFDEILLSTGLFSQKMDETAANPDTTQTTNAEVGV